MGRQWFSPPFLNIYVSLILRPKIPPHQASLVTLMAAVATADAIRNFSGLLPLIKWPNDILLRDRKVAGLLNEIDSEVDRVHFVILGIGINVNMDQKMFSKEIRNVATSLKIETGETVLRKDFLQSLFWQLERWYAVFSEEGSAVILNAWRDRAHIKGKQVKVTSFGETSVGRAIDVDSDGALILETKDGKQRRVVAGDVDFKT